MNTTTGLNYYQILGVTPDADMDTIKKAFRHMMRVYHPDMAGQGGADMTAQLNAAWDTLKDPGRRAQYDLSLKDETPREQPSEPHDEPRAQQRPREYARPRPTTDFTAPRYQHVHVRTVPNTWSWWATIAAPIAYGALTLISATILDHTTFPASLYFYPAAIIGVWALVSALMKHRSPFNQCAAFITLMAITLICLIFFITISLEWFIWFYACELAMLGLLVVIKHSITDRIEARAGGTYGYSEKEAEIKVVGQSHSTALHRHLYEYAQACEHVRVFSASAFSPVTHIVVAGKDIIALAQMPEATSDAAVDQWAASAKNMMRTIGTPQSVVYAVIQTPRRNPYTVTDEQLKVVLDNLPPADVDRRVLSDVWYRVNLMNQMYEVRWSFRAHQERR